MSVDAMSEPDAQRPTGEGPLGRFARRHPVWTFLVLAFGFTWTWWGLAALRGEGGGPSPLIMIGALGPALSAIVLSRRGERSPDEPARRKHRRALLVASLAAGGVLVLQVATGGKATLLGDPTLASQGIGGLDVALLGLTVLLVAVVLAAGSLLLVVVLHAMVNNSFVVTPGTWWALAPAVVLVGVLVLRDRMWRPLAGGGSVPGPGGRERTAPSA